MSDTESKLWLWKIEDGESHVICAESKDAALAILAREFGCDSVAEYSRDKRPKVIDIPMCQMVPVGLLSRMPEKPVWAPDKCEVVGYVRALASEWVTMGPGVVTHHLHLGHAMNLYWSNPTTIHPFRRWLVDWWSISLRTCGTGDNGRWRGVCLLGLSISYMKDMP